MVNERVLQVLYADGDRASHPDVQQFLAEHRCSCECVATGKDAIERARSNTFDLIITDLELPDQGTMSLIDSLTRQTPSPAILVVTSEWSPEETIELLRCGIVDVLSKPLVSNELERTLQRVVRASDANAAEVRTLRSVEELSIRYCFQTGDVASGLPTIPILLDLVAARVLTPNEYLQLLLSLQEAVANAVEHGNLLLASTLKDNIDAAGHDEFSRLRSERLAKPEFASKRIWVEVSYSQRQLTMSVADEGQGFIDRKWSAETAVRTNPSIHGRGVAIMEGSVDEVRFSEGGRKVTLVKALSRA